MKKVISGVLDFTAARLPKKPAAYFLLFTIWLVTLWFLSEGTPAPKEGFEIPHLDKVAHFGYFFGGAGLLAAYLDLRRKSGPSKRFSLVVFTVVVLLVGVLVGRLDEYHQSFTPGRSGNDNGDWLADIAGAATGGWVMLAVVLPRVRARQSKALSKVD